MASDGTGSARVGGLPWLSKAIEAFERCVVLLLMGLLVLIILMSTGELIRLIVRDLAMMRTVLLNLDEMLELFGFFLLVLIGMELLTSLKSYLTERVVHVEVVLEVAMVAIAQKVIILDVYRAGWRTLLGLAALMVALAVGLWATRVSRAHTAAS